MSFFENIITVFDTTGETPTLFGTYHIICLVLTLLATVGLCLVAKKATAKQVRGVVLGVAIVVVLLEVYKQLCYTYDVTEKGLVGDFQWYAFPWQFCSTPMYVGLLAGLTKKGKIHDAACAYLATFAIFAGLCVMIYPGDVYTSVTGINFQTMVCHGTMIPVGAFLLASGHVKLEHKTIFKALPVFAIAVGVAMGLNEIAHVTGLLETDTFNMFFISPYCDPSLPVYSLVQQVVPYPLSLIIYIAGFSAAAYLMLVFAMVIRKLVRSLTRGKKAPAPQTV
jgi:hypothetical protein